MNEELNMETMEETENNDVDSVDEIEVPEGLNITPLAFAGVGLGLLGVGVGVGFGFRKQIKAKLEEAAVNRMIKRGYVVYKNDVEEESEESDEAESDDLD